MTTNKQREAVARALFEARTDFAWGKQQSRFRGVWPATDKEMRGRRQAGDTNLDFAFAEADAAIAAYEANREERKMEISEEKLASILLCAFRYSLGRMTYITSDCSDWLRQYWSILPAAWQKQIHDDITQAIASGRAGHAVDEDNWRTVLDLPIKEQSSQASLNAIERIIQSPPRP